MIYGFRKIGVVFIAVGASFLMADSEPCASITKVKGESCAALDFAWDFSTCKDWVKENVKQEKVCNGSQGELTISHSGEKITAKIERDVTKKDAWTMDGDYSYEKLALSEEKSEAKPISEVAGETSGVTPVVAAVAGSVANAVAGKAEATTQASEVAVQATGESARSVSSLSNEASAKPSELMSDEKKELAPLNETEPKEVTAKVAEDTKTLEASREVATEEVPKPAEEGAEEPEFGLSQDWGGARKNMFDKGVTIDAALANHSMMILKSELSKKYDHATKLDLAFGIDFDKMFGASGLSFGAHIVGMKGTAPTATRLLDVQGVSGLESGGAEQDGETGKAIDTAHIYELYLQKSFMDEQFLGKLGIIDINSDFYALEAAGMFLNGGFGMGKELAQQSLSIFPLTTYGALLAVKTEGGFYMQSAVYDGQATDGSYEHQFGVHLNFHPKQQGWFMAAEAGYANGFFDLPGKYAAGFWSSPSNATTGFYLMAEQGISKKFAVFAKYGLTNTENTANQFGFSLSGGVVYLDPFQLGESNQLGLGITTAGWNKTFTTAETDPTIFVNEMVIELGYRIELLKGFTLQPDLQYVMNVGGVKNAANAAESAVVTSLFVELAL